MLFDVQEKVKIELPEDAGYIVDLYNQDWDERTGQAFEVANFIELTKDRNTLLDIGSHVGFFSYLFYSNNNQGNKRVYSIEPSEPYLQVAAQILYSNKWLDDIFIFNLLIGDQQSEAECLWETGADTLVVDYEVTSDTRFGIKEGRTGKHKIRMITVDNFYWLVEMGMENSMAAQVYNMEPQDEEKVIEKKDKVVDNTDLVIDTIKIDVEGYEFRVLKGGIQAINKHRPLIFLEVHKERLALYNNSIFHVYNILEKMEYNLFDLHMNPVKDKDHYSSLFRSDKGRPVEVRLVCQPREIMY